MITLLVLIADVFPVSLLHRDDRRIILGFAGVISLALYAPFNLYASGFSRFAPLVLAILAIATRRPRTAMVALLILAAFDFHLLRSRNLFDYAVNPLVAVWAIVYWIVVATRRPRIRQLALMLFAASPLFAQEPPVNARATNLYLGFAKSQPNWHGQATFRSISMEWAGFAPRLLTNHLPNTRAGISLTYSDVVQPRSWFGHRYGDPDDHVRAEWALFFARHYWRRDARVSPMLDLGTGPMWSNRRVPAATYRLNFHSQLGLGATVGSRLQVLYRFSHISNGEFGPRNPGWNVHALWIGMRMGGK
jgi:lipid A 3-O-deacylase PagL